MKKPLLYLALFIVFLLAYLSYNTWSPVLFHLIDDPETNKRLNGLESILFIIVTIFASITGFLSWQKHKQPANKSSLEKEQPTAQHSLQSNSQHQLTTIDTSIIIDKETCPYKGLTAFSQEDTHLFFGRQNEIDEALGYIGRPVSGTPNSPLCYWLQVEGNSGAGKSSLVKAGLLPAFTDKILKLKLLHTGITNWKVIEPMTPGKKPLDRLANALEKSFDKCGLSQRKADLNANTEALSNMLRDQANQMEGNSAFVLVVDQFEELFTLSNKEEKQQFDAQLAHALKNEDCPLCLISTVRLDFLEGFEQLPELSEMYNRHCKRQLLKTISIEGLQEAIEKPAEQAGLDVSEVSTAILQQAQNEVGALPLVENALRVLWQNRESNKLSGTFFAEKGGLAGLLEEQADELLEAIEHKIKGGRKDALELLLKLTRVNDEGRHTRRRLAISEAWLIAGGKKGKLQHGQKIVDYLTGRLNAINTQAKGEGQLRLLATTGEHEEKQEVDIIHETLIRSRGDKNADNKLIGYWKTLYDYIDKHRDREFYRDQLKRKAEQWQSSQGMSRWLKLASWRDLKRYNNIRLPKDLLEYRYRAISKRIAWLQGGLIAILLGFVLESYIWTLNNAMPPSYMLMQQKFRLMSWGVIDEPFNPKEDLVGVPAAKGEFRIGEYDDEFGEMANNSLKESGSYSRQNFGYPSVLIKEQKAFEIGKHEVTYEQYDYYVWQQKNSENPLSYPSGASKNNERGKRAVANVSWVDANRYLKWLESKTPKYKYRLPTEAEWEYAARAGSKTAYWMGDDIGQNKANCDGCGSEWDKTISPIGSFKPNDFGLYDTAGNLWEWTCSDWQVEFDGSESSCSQKAEKEGSRVLRGGSWIINTDWLRSSARFRSITGLSSYNVGFRIFRRSRTN